MPPPAPPPLTPPQVAQAQNNGHTAEYAPMGQLVTKRPLDQDDQEVPESKRVRDGEDVTPSPPPQLAEGAVLSSQPQPILSGGE